MRVEFHGKTFDERTDWAAYVRDVLARPWAHSELPEDLPVGAALSALASRLAGTPLARGLAAACLDLVERGTPAEREAVRKVPLDAAPDVGERLLRLLRGERDRVAREGWIDRMVGDLLRLWPDNADVLDVLHAEASRPDRTPGVLQLAARHDPEWLGPQIAALVPVDGMLLALLVTGAPPGRSGPVVDGIVASAAHDRELREFLRSGNLPDAARERVEALLA